MGKRQVFTMSEWFDTFGYGKFRFRREVEPWVYQYKTLTEWFMDTHYKWKKPDTPVRIKYDTLTDWWNRIGFVVAGTVDRVFYET